MSCVCRIIRPVQKEWVVLEFDPLFHKTKSDSESSASKFWDITSCHGGGSCPKNNMTDHKEHVIFVDKRVS